MIHEQLTHLFCIYFCTARISEQLCWKKSDNFGVELFTAMNEKQLMLGRVYFYCEGKVMYSR